MPLSRQQLCCLPLILLLSVLACFAKDTKPLIDSPGRFQPPFNKSEPPPLPSYCEKYAQAYLPSIWNDLLPWSNGIRVELVNSAANRWTMDRRSRYPGIAVSFRNGSVFLFRNAHLAKVPKHHAREAIIYMEVFMDLSRRHGATIPDIDFVLATNDIPSVNIAKIPVNVSITRLPQFRYCRSHESPNILIPVWNLYDLNYSSNFLAPIDNTFSDPPWERREPKLYGRLGRWDRFVYPGSRATYRNGIKTPRKWFTSWTRSLNDSRIDVKDGPYVPMAMWRKYKYLMFVDGITFSSKLEKLLPLGSAVVKEESGYKSFYQMQMRPFEHYVPFWYDRPQEALDALAWLQTHDEEARRIGLNAQRFAKEMLNKQALRCYWLTLFREYAKLLRYNPAEVQHDAWIPVAQYLEDFRANKFHLSEEWYKFAMGRHPGAYEFEDPFGVPEN